MGKRSIVFCDLTKTEIPDGDEIVTITIKRQGKKSGRSYELSSSAAAKLEQQLVAGKEATLEEDWSFRNAITFERAKPNINITTLGDLDSIEDDSKFVASKKKELREQGVIEDDREIPIESGISVAIGGDGGDCAHMNKGPIQTTLKNKKRFIYRICRGCGRHVPEKTADDKKGFLTAKLPPDVSVRDISNE